MTNVDFSRKTMDSISIIIPTYNEEQNIAENLRLLRDYLETIPYDYEIITVDDGSDDSTCAKIEEATTPISPKIRLIINKVNQGKGAVVKQGVLSAKGHYIFFTDADLPYNLSFIKLGLEKLQQGVEMVAGSRYETTTGKKTSPFQIRTLSSKVFRTIAHILIKTKAHDTQCGFKGFTRDVAILLFSRSIINGFGFDIEILFLANKFNVKIANLPVFYSGAERESRVKVIKDSLKILLETVSVLVNNNTGRYS